MQAQSVHVSQVLGMEVSGKGGNEVERKKQVEGGRWVGERQELPKNNMGSGVAQKF
jgi:hypothetical protein